MKKNFSNVLELLSSFEVLDIRQHKTEMLRDEKE
jgi:hypothetical protein